MRDGRRGDRYLDECGLCRNEVGEIDDPQQCRGEGKCHCDCGRNRSDRPRWYGAGGDGGPGGPGDHGSRGFGEHGGEHFDGGIVILAAAVLLAVLITWLIARRRSTVVTPPSGNAEAILSERLARSEISVDDYRTTLAALHETSSS